MLGHDVRNIDEGVGGPQDPSILLSPALVSNDLSGFEIARAPRPSLARLPERSETRSTPS